MKVVEWDNPLVGLMALETAVSWALISAVSMADRLVDAWASLRDMRTAGPKDITTVEAMDVFVAA